MKQLTVAYLRVSTASQRDEQTIATQRDSLARYCEANGIHIDQSFEDDGISGSIELHQRPSGSELFKLINSGAVKTLLLFHADRIGRDLIDSLLFHRLAETRGVRVVGISDGTDSAREGSMLATEIKSVIASEYRRDCVRRTKAGLRRRASEGKVSTRPPFGYLAQDGFLVIDETRAEVVRSVFAKFTQGLRTLEIVTWLNESNAPSPKGRGWRCDTLIYLLKNRVYSGEFIAFKTPRRQPGGGKRLPRDSSDQIVINCPAIVTQEIFELAQNRIAFNRLWCSTSRKNFYLLKSLIVCGQCGRAFIGHTVSGRRYKDRRYADVAYYECGTLTNRDYKFCGNARVNAARLEKAIWNQIESFLDSPLRVIERLRSRYNAQTVSSDQATEKKAKRRADRKTKNREAVDRLVLAVARGIVTDSDALRAREALDRELEEIERDSAALRDALAAGRLQQQRLVDARELLGVLRSKLEEGFNSQKRAEIARSLVRQIVVNKRKGGGARVTVKYVFPESPAPLTMDWG